MDTLDRLIASLGSSSGASGRAGIFDDEENASKLLWTDFGTVTAPARPTISRALDEEQAVAEVAKPLGAGIDRGKVNAEAAVAVAVEAVAERTRDLIQSNVPPPLAEATLEARRARGNSSEATLVDTGDMLAAVRAETKPGAKGWPNG